MLWRFGLTQLQAGLLSLKEKLQVLLHFLQLKLVVHYVHVLGSGGSRGALMLTRSQMLGWRERRGCLLLGRRGRRGRKWQLLLWWWLKVAELQLLVVAKLHLDGGCLQGGRGTGSLLNILWGDDAHGLGSQLLPQPLGCALRLCRGLGFQPGLKQLWWVRIAGQFLLPGQQCGALLGAQLLRHHLGGLPKAVHWVYAGWGGLAFEGGRAWGAVGAAHG